jgi:hypothetical protein
VQLVVVDRGELPEDLAARVYRARERELALEHADQVGEAVGREVDAFEHVEGVGLRRIDLQQRLGRSHRRLVVAERILVDARERGQQRYARGAVDQRGQGGLDVFGELAMRAGGLRQALVALARPALAGGLRERQAEKPVGVGRVA